MVSWSGKGPSKYRRSTMSKKSKVTLDLTKILDEAVESHLPEPVVEEASPAAEGTPPVQAPVTEANRTIPNDIAGKTFWLGKAPYRPRAQHNMDSWERMCRHLAKGGTSGAVLASELLVNGKHPDKTHFDFVSYLERRGALTTTEPKSA